MKKPSGFGDEEAKRIIQRAAEIDAQDQKTLDATALREIATEAGISRASVDQALEEHLRAPQSLAARLRRRPGLLLAGAILAAFVLMRLFP